jgi:hypothetical protein
VAGRRGAEGKEEKNKRHRGRHKLTSEIPLLSSWIMVSPVAALEVGAI